MSKKLNILVVDDEATICEVIRRTLEKEGFDITIANDGLQALDQMKKQKFDLIITDELMPKISGTVFLELSKEKKGVTPVVFMTGYPSDELEQYAQKAADAFLVKPFSLDKLKEIVSELVGDGKNSGKELVCIVLGLEFYASPKKARLLKTTVTDLLLSRLHRQGLIAVDVKPAVDLTPTFSDIKKKNQLRKKKEPSIS